MLSDRSVLIFDFDGTLYQGEGVSRLFLSSILAEIDRPELFDLAWDTAKSIYDGSHSCRIGEHIIRTGVHKHNSPPPRERYSRHLARLSSISDSALPHEGEETLHRIGDFWGVVFAVTEYLIPDFGVYREAFRRTRKALAMSPSLLQPDPRTRAVFEALSEAHYLILMSNSPGPDGEGLIDSLGVCHLFDEIHFESQKPNGLSKLLTSIADRPDVLHSGVVAFGDHPWNDLYPARELGAKTVLVSPFDEFDRPYWSYRVRSTGELLTLLDAEMQAGAA